MWRKGRPSERRSGGEARLKSWNRLAPAASTLLWSATPAAAPTLPDEDVTSCKPQLDAPDAAFGGVWETAGFAIETVDIIGGPGGLCVTAPVCIDLDGSSSNAGVVRTVEAVEAVDPLPSFFLFGNGRSGLDDLRAVFGDDERTRPGIGPQADIGGIRNVAAGPGGSRRSFEALSADTVGPIPHSVRATPVTPPTPPSNQAPLPGALPMALAASAGRGDWAGRGASARRRR
ncbi:MAG: hypothetical protein AAFU61_07430 [Pseudomonadota bacterium]